MTKPTRPKIKDTPSDTPTATPILTFFFNGSDGWEKGVAAASRALADVLDVSMLDEIYKAPVVVEAVVVLEGLAGSNCETVLGALAALRSWPWILPLRSNTL